jgi:hypothetical protein
MAVDLAHDLWQELKRYIAISDREDAADTLVNVLIENDYDAGQIRDSFKGDGDIKRALQSYLDDLEEEDLDEDDEDDYDDSY